MKKPARQRWFLRNGQAVIGAACNFAFNKTPVQGQGFRVPNKYSTESYNQSNANAGLPAGLHDRERGSRSGVSIGALVAESLTGKPAEIAPPCSPIAPKRPAPSAPGPHRGTGNRCGHDPAAPRLDVEFPDRLPRVLARAIERFSDYYDRPALLPSLNKAHYTITAGSYAATLTGNPADRVAALAARSMRRQRSEAREACIAMLGAIIACMDLSTLLVGVRNGAELLPVTMPYLAQRSGLSESRAQRAMVALKAAGLIKVHPVAKRQPDGSYKGVAAVRNVNPLLFQAFGLAVWLKYERDRASKRLKKAQDKAREAETQTLTGGARLDLMLERPQLPAQRRRRAPGSSAGDDVPAAENAQAAFYALKARLPEHLARELMLLLTAAAGDGGGDPYKTAIDQYRRNNG